jgi:hypothetical protein
MAKIDYNAINFKNRDIDKFSTKFGQTKTDPETKAKQDAIRTKGMTENQINLYNQKGALGQKIYAKNVAKKNVATESGKSSTTDKSTKSTLTPEQKETKKTNRSERLNKTLGTVGTLVGSTLGAIGLYNQSKNKQSNP